MPGGFEQPLLLGIRVCTATSSLSRQVEEAKEEVGRDTDRRRRKIVGRCIGQVKEEMGRRVNGEI
jgi:hypothetical protein